MRVPGQLFGRFRVIRDYSVITLTENTAFLPLFSPSVGFSPLGRYKLSPEEKQGLRTAYFAFFRFSCAFACLVRHRSRICNVGRYRVKLVFRGSLVQLRGGFSGAVRFRLRPLVGVVESFRPVHVSVSVSCAWCVGVPGLAKCVGRESALAAKLKPHHKKTAPPLPPSLMRGGPFFFFFSFFLFLYIIGLNFG